MTPESRRLASSGSLRVAQEPVKIELSEAAVAPLSEHAPEPTRWLLVLEDVVVGERPGAWDVVLGSVDGAAADDVDERRLGRVSFFGAAKTGRGFVHVLDVSAKGPTLGRVLRGGRSPWVITFVPVYDWSDAIEIGAVHLDVR